MESMNKMSWRRGRGAEDRCTQILVRLGTSVFADREEKGTG